MSAQDKVKQANDLSAVLKDLSGELERARSRVNLEEDKDGSRLLAAFNVWERYDRAQTAYMKVMSEAMHELGVSAGLSGIAVDMFVKVATDKMMVDKLEAARRWRWTLDNSVVKNVT